MQSRAPRKLRRYFLGRACEALGDVEAADEHYEHVVFLASDSRPRRKSHEHLADGQSDEHNASPGQHGSNVPFFSVWKQMREPVAGA